MDRVSLGNGKKTFFFFTGFFPQKKNTQEGREPELSLSMELAKV